CEVTLQNLRPKTKKPQHCCGGHWLRLSWFHAARRFPAADLPVLLSDTTSKATFWPSRRLRKPDCSTALICTNTSLPPSSGLMKPYPLSGLNHFTVPVVIGAFLKAVEM